MNKEDFDILTKALQEENILYNKEEVGPENLPELAEVVFDIQNQGLRLITKSLSGAASFNDGKKLCDFRKRFQITCTYVGKSLNSEQIKVSPPSHRVAYTEANGVLNFVINNMGDNCTIQIPS